jgi:Ca-activated chloride channel family protein
VPREPSNPFYSSQHRPYASFGADVDQASYTLCRRSVEEWNRLPDPGTVRVEEFLNYFTYSYAAPSRERMLAVYPEMAVCPWNPEHYVVRVAVRAAEVNLREAPAANLVFLVDVSGSMYPQDRLPLVKQALLMLLDTLRPHDRVALVTYAGSSGVVLESTPASHKAKIRQAIEALGAGGSTAGARGILTAYEVAKRHFIAGGNNRVILCTDGDFNVGVSDIAGLKRLIEEKREEGVFLTTLGFGTSGYADQVMETLADNGNGFYAYVSNLAEAQRIFTKGLMGSLLTVAKDVKFQLAFNPEVIRGYRLIGYENRRLTYREFHDDRRDAGDLGAGHYLTVLLELVPAHASAQTLDCTPDTTMLASDQPQWSGANWLTLRMRHKQPAADSSAYWCFNLASAPVPASNPTSDSRWAIGVAWVAQLMRGAGDVPAHTWAQAIAYCQQAQGTDPDGSRAQFVQWAQKAAQLASLNPQAEAGR